MLVMLVMSLLLMLPLLQGTVSLLLAMADLPIARTAENCMLASVAATKLLRWLKELSGCSISSSRTMSRISSSQLPWSLWGCAIAGSKPVEWILRWIMLWILSTALAWTSGKQEQKSESRWWNPFVHAFITIWLMFLALDKLYASPHGPTSGGTPNSQVFEANR